MPSLPKSVRPLKDANYKLRERKGRLLLSIPPSKQNSFGLITHNTVVHLSIDIKMASLS
jgi:hypothetical protein